MNLDEARAVDDAAIVTALRSGKGALVALWPDDIPAPSDEVALYDGAGRAAALVAVTDRPRLARLLLEALRLTTIDPADGAAVDDTGQVIGTLGAVSGSRKTKLQAKRAELAAAQADQLAQLDARIASL